MDREEVIKWLSIMKANLNSFPVVSNAKKIEALAETIRLLKNEQSKEPTGSTTKNDPEVDCISRQAVLEIYDEWFATCNIADKKESPKAKINALPKVTPIRPKGHWINHSDEGYVECPKCGSATNCDDNITDLHFCFSCGAEMSEVKDGKIKD